MMEIGGWWSKCETLIEIHQSQKNRRGWDVRFPQKTNPSQTLIMSLPLCQKHIYIYITWKDVCGVPLCLGIFFMTITRYQCDYGTIDRSTSWGVSISIQLATSPCHNELLLWVVLPWTIPGLVAKKTWCFGIIWYTILNFPFNSKLIFRSFSLSLAGEYYDFWVLLQSNFVPSQQVPYQGCQGTIDHRPIAFLDSLEYAQAKQWMNLGLTTPDHLFNSSWILVLFSCPGSREVHGNTQSLRL